ncbi:Poly(A) RNA polymerase gld-2 homolog A [Gryllus bimaculatus]|nr:Poly(A) RNA polymerase gld-2 homolog A [Gryllus bimaculatus]
MAESVEIVKEKSGSEKFLSTTGDVRKHPLQERSERVHLQEKMTEENMHHGGVGENDFDNEHKKKKKKKKPKSVENGGIDACAKVQNLMQSSGGGILAPTLNAKQQALLKQHHIVFKKPTMKNRGRFMCKLCNYFCDSWVVLENHIDSLSHFNALEGIIEAESVNLLPAPVDEQKRVLTDMIKKLISENGISKVGERHTILQRIEEYIKATYPSCSVKLYGSSKYMAGLAHSDVNFNITIPLTKDRPSIMMAVYAHIKGDEDNYRNVNFNMSADIPSIAFEDGSSNLPCTIAFSNAHACDVALILHKYLSLDQRALELATAFRYWAHLCCLDQIECGTLPAHAFPILVIYYLQQLEDPVLPVLSEHEIYGEESAMPEVLDPSVPSNYKWETKNKMSLGELWLGLFKFYVVDIDVQERVISIKTKEPVLQASKKWNNKRLGIEDPVAPKRNIAKTIVNTKLFYYFMSCIRTSFICHPCFLTDQQLNEKSPNQVIDPGDPNFKNIGQFIVTPEQAQLLCQKFNPKYLIYQFSKQSFVGGKNLPIVCTYCREEGHTKEKCPEDSLPPLEKLPNLPKSYLKKLSSMCETIYEMWALTPSELEDRENIVSHLLQFLSKKFPDVALTLFGSSCNGFGLKRSDIDICFTFTTCPPEEELDFAKLIQDLYGLLKKYSPFSNLVPITTAKVPILKFFHCNSKLDGDISFHNTLALKNTKLIRTYSNIDARAKILGYVLKRFAKICNICDASKGSLSSYAYILMMIHFLQQCNPPVLPVLQEICRPCSTEEYILENCDTYFFEDIDRLSYFWPEYGKNGKSVGELWIEFLCYYTEIYNYKEYVISIRRKRPMSKFEKLWNSKSMAIEDPFDVNHNLGIGLSPKMHQFILKALRNGRSYFSNVSNLENLPDIKPLIKAADKYFEASKVKGSPPDRGCHNCKRIGHVVKDCPARMQRRDESSESKEYQMDRYAQSPKSSKHNNMRKGNTKGNSNYDVGNWPEGSGLLDEPVSRNTLRNDRGRNSSKGSPNHELGLQEVNMPRDDPNVQRIPLRQDKARRTMWRNKSLPPTNPVPVTPLVSTSHWNIRPVPLSYVNVSPEIQVQLQALAKKWHVGPEHHNEAVQPRRIVGCQPQKRTGGGVFDVYTQPSDSIPSREFHKTTNYPSNFQG